MAKRCIYDLPNHLDFVSTCVNIGMKKEVRLNERVGKYYDERKKLDVFFPRLSFR